MRFVADENVPLQAVASLRKNGHEILSICESLPQTADEDILGIAEKDRRIVLTLDKDYGLVTLSQVKSPEMGTIEEVHAREFAMERLLNVVVFLDRDDLASIALIK
ncbi:MAG: DUF5615 family PIN-like protein [Methanothrix sp.]|nr:DUF5615 family PIN-like protein [Methanothrix sp.]MDD4447704.1 DUF5615 family PIN-like protein [Methanothrix sp.]